MMHSYLGECDKLLAQCDKNQENEHLGQAIRRFRRSWELAERVTESLTQDKLFAAAGLFQCCLHTGRLDAPADVGKKLGELAGGKPFPSGYAKKQLAGVLGQCLAQVDQDWIAQLADLARDDG
jgi:hypothetical protein